MHWVAKRAAAIEGAAETRRSALPGPHGCGTNLTRTLDCLLRELLLKPALPKTACMERATMDSAAVVCEAYYCSTDCYCSKDCTTDTMSAVCLVSRAAYCTFLLLPRDAIESTQVGEVPFACFHHSPEELHHHFKLVKCHLATLKYCC